MGSAVASREATTRRKPSGKRKAEKPIYGLDAIFVREVKQKIHLSLTAGNTRRWSAQYAGITMAMMNEWILVDPEFEASVLRDEATAMCEVVGHLRQSCRRGNPSSIHFYLRERDPETWAQSQRNDPLDRLTTDDIDRQIREAELEAAQLRTRLNDGRGAVSSEPAALPASQAGGDTSSPAGGGAPL